MHSISRREFLHKGTATAAILTDALSHHVWAASSERPIGIQLYTVDADLQKDVSATLKQIRAIGYTEVESSSFDGLTARQFRNALDEAGLSCRSAHVHMDSPDLSQVFDDAHTIGAHFVVSSALFPPKLGHPPTRDDYRQMATRLNAIAEKGKAGQLAIRVP